MQSYTKRDNGIGVYSRNLTQHIFQKIFLILPDVGKEWLLRSVWGATGFYALAKDQKGTDPYGL